MMDVTDKIFWVVSRNVRSIRTLDRLRLLDFDRGMYCDLALLAGAVWLLIKWTPVGITVNEIVDLLETAASLPRNMLETETCVVVADLARSGFVRKRPSGEPVRGRRNAPAQAVGEGGTRSVKTDKDVEWLISPSTLATYTEDGAVVLDVPKGICYSLKAVASRIWRAMESSPSGITLEGIVRVLEETSNWRGGLRRSGNSSTSRYDAVEPDDKHKAALIEIAQIGGTTMTYERPDIQLLYALHAPGDQSISKPSDEPVGMSLRARESQEFTGNNVGRDPLNLSDVSKHVSLPRSARQAHWVFRDSGGKAIKGYVKEGVSRVLQNNCKLQTQPKKRRKELPRAPRSKLHLINLRSTLPRAAHRASNTPKVGKGNGVDITGWLVSPSVRSTYIGDGAVLLNVKAGLCYSLDGVAAHVWVTIEGSPAGISFEGIVDVLETHSTVSREELESAARDCVGALRREGLVQPRDASLQHSSMREGQTVISEQPFVQRLDTVESLVDQLFPQRVESNMDWRAKKLKDLIDLNPAKIHDSLGDVCSQLRLSLSDRQARRLFKESAGISMKEYARKRCLVFAARQLQNTDDPIKVIATDAGYRTLQGFEKGFYGLFRLTPVEFRRMWHRSQVTA